MRARLGANPKQHTLGHIDCPACAQDTQLLYQALTPELLFSVAFEIWINNRRLNPRGKRTKARFLSKDTVRDYTTCAEALGQYFGDCPLHRIRVADLMEYQQLRAANPYDPRGKFRCVGPDEVVRKKFDTHAEAKAWAAEHGDNHRIVQTLWAYEASGNCIRKEVALLINILNSAKLWNESCEEELIRVQADENDEWRAMTIAQQHALLHVGASRLEFRFIYQYAIVALQTGAGPHELRQMQLCNVLLDNRLIQIPCGGAKNKYRVRMIPLVTEDAMWAMEGLLARAYELGSKQPTDYVFPLQASRTHYDPKRPMSESGLKKPWDALRQAAGLPELRIYDLRHTCMTRMAEAGVPLPVAMTFLGHMTEASQRRYTSICMAAQRGWGESVWGADSVSAQLRGFEGVSDAWGGKRKPVRAEVPERYRAKVASVAQDLDRFSRRG